MGAEPRVFAQAPLAAPFRALTWVYALLCAALPAAAGLAPAAARPGLLLGGLALLLGGLSVPLWFRPRRLRVDAEGLELEWALRRRRLRRGEIAGAEILGLRELGFLLRFGVGGLGGVYGRFWSSRRGWLDIYATRERELVLLRPVSGRPLLLSPADPAGFLEALGC